MCIWQLGFHRLLISSRTLLEDLLLRASFLGSHSWALIPHVITLHTQSPGLSIGYLSIYAGNASGG
jgi:hypothetical protein